MATRVGDLDVDELLALLRDELRALARQAVDEALRDSELRDAVAPPPAPDDRRDQPLNLPVDDVGPWPADLSLRREDLYDADGR